MASKKSFKTEMGKGSGAAASYITSAQDAVISEVNELKSKRVNLLIKPSIYEDTAKIATMKRVSVNELINIALEAYAADHKELITKYDMTFD